ncbi:CD109 antigen-like [Watersipora subatra]|uniref:CD109 antigen-like n=1 Tax=Watersipora subatra TaxID=2589382 RepID=UPI00355C1A41
MASRGSGTRCMLLACMTVFFPVYEAGIIEKQATYSVLAPTTVRPNTIFKVSATIIHLEYETMTVTAAIKKTSYDGKSTEAICNAAETFSRPGSGDISMQTPEEMTSGNYSLVIAAYSDSLLLGLIFRNETELFYENKQVSVFITTSKPFYRRGETVEFRIIPVQKNLKPISEAMDIRIKDPHGVVVREWFSEHTNAGGVVSLSYPLNKQYLLFSQWTIEVECLFQIYTKPFLVDEWYPVLRFINVTMPSSMFSDSLGLAGVAEARWNNQLKIIGNATLKLEVISLSGEKYTPIVRKIDYFTGRINFMFERKEIEAVAGGPNSLIGKELKVTLSAQEWWINTTQSGSQSAIVYDKHPAIKFLEGSAMTFQPDQPFSVHIAAQHGDGSPVAVKNPNRKIMVTVTKASNSGNDETWTEEVELSAEGSVAELWLYPTDATQRFSLKATYSGVENTRRQLVATKFWSPTGFYLHVSTTTKKPTVGQFMSFDLVSNAFVDRLYYAIISKGNIIVSDTLDMYGMSKQIALALSQDMFPSSKFLAYFITPNSQVIADSLNFHVDNGKQGQLTARLNRGKDLSYKNIELTLITDPLSYVAFGALEYQLYNQGVRNSLTSQEVTEELYSYEAHSNTSIYHTWLRNGQAAGSYYTHTQSYGHDTNSTFFYAGVYILTDANVSAVYTHCNRTKGEFPCMDGKTCYNQQDICNGRAECAADHRDEMGCKNDSSPVVLYNDKHWSSKNIRIRYPSSGFMWSEQFTKPDGRNDLSFPIVNFETDWVITALAMNSENGLVLLEEPVMLADLRPLIMKVEGQPQVRMYEHVTLSVAIFNRWREDLDVLVTLKKSRDYLPVIWENGDAVLGSGDHQVMMPVMAGTDRQIYVPVMMQRTGTVFVEIEASSCVWSWTHRQKFDVGYNGAPESYVTSYQVDLTIANSVRTPDLHIPVKEKLVDPEIRLQNYIMDSPKTEIHVIGDIVGIGFTQETSSILTGKSLLQSADYSSFNALFNFAVNFYTLQNARTLSSISEEKTNVVIDFLNKKLQEIFTYMNLDGSFNLFRWSQKPNTWVTALTIDVLLRVKQQSRDLIRQMQIPQAPLEKSASWLAQQRGVIEGAVTEVGVLNNKMFESRLQVEVNGMLVPSNVSLTALTVIALSKSVQTNQSSKADVARARTQGAGYIASLINKMDDPFELAISTYALFQSNHDQQEAALRKLTAMNRTVQDTLYWSTEDMPVAEVTPDLGTQIKLDSKQIHRLTAYSVTTTSYALLSYLKSSQSEKDINNIQKYLQSQRMNIGGWASTYDTLMAVEALSKLAALNQDRSNYNMMMTFKSDQAPDWSETVHLSRDNWFYRQKVSLPSHWGSIQAYASGHGVALMQMHTEVSYDRIDLFRKPGADYFEINYSMLTRGFNHSFIDYRICPSWKGPGERSGAAVLEFTLPSGYAIPNGPAQNFVKAASKSSSIRQAEMKGSHITAYFDYLDRTKDNCYIMTSFRKRPVANVTEQQYMKVYDYFEPGVYSQALIGRIEFRRLTVCLICGTYQCGYCPGYAVSVRNISNSYLLTVLLVVLFVYNRLTANGWV